MSDGCDALTPLLASRHYARVREADTETAVQPSLPSLFERARRSAKEVRARLDDIERRRGGHHG